MIQTALLLSGKYKHIREIARPLPNRRFGKSAVRVQYVADNGTVHVDAYEQIIRSLDLQATRAPLGVKQMFWGF